MGRQTGTVRLKGKVGNLTFAKTANGDEARIETFLTGDKMKSDSRFKRTRENWAEFARAGKAAKLIRRALEKAAKDATDRYIHGRMVKLTLQVVKSDPVNDRGERQIQFGTFDVLRNFEFNRKQPLTGTFRDDFQVNIDRAAGTAEVVLADLIPNSGITLLEGATHAKLTAGVAELDWEAEEFVQDAVSSANLLLGPQIEPAQTLSLSFTAGTDKTILVVFGITFYQEVNGKFYTLFDGGRNAMAIVGVDHV